MSETDVNIAVLILLVLFLLVMVMRHGKRIDDERNPPLPKDKTLFCRNGHAIPFPFSREKGTWCYRCEEEEPVFKLPKPPPAGPHDEGPFR